MLTSGGSLRAGRMTRILAVLLVVAGTLVGGLMGPGPARAATAGHAPRSVIGPPGGNAGRSPADPGAKQCFYAIPDCSSSNPAAAFSIVSNGDTSGCTFQYMTNWGDGTTDTQTFPGGPNGAILYTFRHTYTGSPATFTITVTGQTLTGSCFANGGTLQFTLAGTGVQAVRFADTGASAPGVEGLPVIKDDVSPVQKDRSWLPPGLTSCNGLASPQDFDYLDCGSPLPTGTPVKDWPVIYTAGGTLTINQVIFAANSDINDPMVTATATVTGGSSSLTLAATRLAKTQLAGGGYELTGNRLSFSGTLPAVPGRDQLAITWTVTGGAAYGTMPAGTSQHTVYLTAGPYVAPTAGGVADPEVMKPYESLVDVGTVAAAGASGQQAVLTAILAAFATRAVAHPSLDPATGAVTSGPSFKYYDNRWPAIGDWWNRSFGLCPAFAGFLKDNTGHCGNWAQFLAGVLAFQGISADEVGLRTSSGFYPGFNPGPDPAGGSAFDDAYMLVDPALWSFGRKNAPGPFPYQDQVQVTSGQVTIAGTHVRYRPSSSILVGQGPVYDPPPMFADGDHAIVGVTLTGATAPVYVDPSYGNPAPPAQPYPTLAAYEPTAIAGFAVVYQQGSGGTLTPLPVEDIATTCATSTCVFDAVPYAPPPPVAAGRRIR